MLYSRHYLHVANDVNIWLRPVTETPVLHEGLKQHQPICEACRKRSCSYLGGTSNCWTELDKVLYMTVCYIEVRFEWVNGLVQLES